MSTTLNFRGEKHSLLFEWMYKDATNFSTRKIERCYEILKNTKDKNLRVNGYDKGAFLKLRELLENMTPEYY